jgi:hypothetical protein
VAVACKAAAGAAGSSCVVQAGCGPRPLAPVLVTDGMESETIAARSPYQRPGAQRHTENAALELKPPARLIAVANDRRAGPVPTDKPVAWIRVLCCHIPRPQCNASMMHRVAGLAIRGHMRGRSCARHGQLKARPPCARRPGRDRIKSLANEPQPRLVARACVFCAKPRGDSGIDWSRASFKRPRPLHPHTTTTTTTTTGSGSDAPLLLWH